MIASLATTMGLASARRPTFERNSMRNKLTSNLANNSGLALMRALNGAGGSGGKAMTATSAEWPSMAGSELDHAFSCPSAPMVGEEAAATVVGSSLGAIDT